MVYAGVYQKHLNSDKVVTCQKGFTKHFEHRIGENFIVNLSN